MALFARIGRREWLTGLAAGGGVLWSGQVLGGAARPVSLRRLLQASEYSLVASAVSSTASWEDTGGRGQRIVSYHRVDVHESLDGRSPADSALYVRTFGGRVGDVAQRVHGEVSLTPGKPCVLFLRGGVAGAFSVVGMAQGHYPLVEDAEGTPRLQASPFLGDFVHPDPLSAVNRLRGKTLASCEQLIAEELNL